MVNKRVAMVSTGGTIEKTYDPFNGALTNHVSVLDVLLGALELRGLALDRVPLMNKDSLDMTEDDHVAVAECAYGLARSYDGVVVVHGTDKLSVSGERTLALGPPDVPIVFTGAMRPYELRSTDAVQNVTEALMAVQLLLPGVYCVIHNRVLEFPGVVKNRHAGTFVMG